MRVLVRAATALSIFGFASIASAQTPYATQPLPQGPPPPNSANAGNGEYVAPMYQQTQPSYVPQSVAMSGPAYIKTWSEGDPIPPGYHPVSRVRTGLLVGGLVTFGSMYLISVLTAAMTLDICKLVNNASAKPNCNAPTFLFVPVAGPFIEMGRSASAGISDSATVMTLLVLDGVVQVAGVAMAVAGIAWPKVILQRNDLGAVGKKTTVATIEPVLGGGQNGFKITF